MTTKYLVQLGLCYQPKNKLHKAIQEFVGKQHRKVIDRSVLSAYKRQLENKINTLNSQFPKCTSVKCNFWKSDTDEHLHLENVVSLSMLKFEEK